MVAGRVVGVQDPAIPRGPVEVLAAASRGVLTPPVQQPWEQAQGRLELLLVANHERGRAVRTAVATAASCESELRVRVAAHTGVGQQAADLPTSSQPHKARSSWRPTNCSLSGWLFPSYGT